MKLARSKSRLINFILTGAFIIGFSGIAPSVSNAVTCTYNGCANKNPDTTGCSSGASNLSEFSGAYDSVVVQLRYSPSCHSVWVRILDDCVNEVRYSRPYLETGYVDYYGTYHLQGRFIGPAACINGTNVWTTMSSSRRERMRFGYARDDGSLFESKVHLTGCNDCY